MSDLVERLRHRALARVATNAKNAKADAELDTEAAAHIEALKAKIAAIKGCYEAAYAEGLTQKLLDQEEVGAGSLYNIVWRRLLPVWNLLIEEVAKDKPGRLIDGVEAQLAERVRVKPLQWNECRALYGGRKLVATDCFGREYARLDLKGQPDDFIHDFKARVQEAYNTAILSALEASPAPMVTEDRPTHCGGCGETDPAKRCVGCLADFGPSASSAAAEEERGSRT